MDPLPQAAGAVPTGNSRLWLLVLLALIIWQGWLTLSLFGTAQPFQTLLNDQPIVSGAHPLHLYFGWLGASSLRSTGSLYCYDPAFQAGYPKTPVFDGGSRPAELFLTVAGGEYNPAAYKIGLALCCLAVPVLLAVAARGSGLSRATTTAAVAIGLLVWWGDPCRGALEAGDLDLLIGGLVAAAFVGLLLAFDRAADFTTWLGLLITGTLGWLTHPMLFLVLFPLLLIYYLSVGPRHRLGWHAALLGILLTAPGLNAFWLSSWLQSWWLKLPIRFDGIALPHRTWATFWQAACWGDPADRALAAALFVVAFGGVIVLNQTRQRTAARLLGFGTAGLAILTLAGMAWPSVGRFGTAHLFMPALWLAIPAAVFGLSHLAHFLGKISGTARRGALATCTAVVAVAVVGNSIGPARTGRLFAAEPFQIGLTAEHQAAVETIQSATDDSARILWEDTPGPRESARWTALLPVLTGRTLIGGLGADVCIEHAYPSLVGERLAGRPIGEWSDAQLQEYCRRYNVGWVVCRSPAAVARFAAWPDAVRKADVSEGPMGHMFALRASSFVLKGKAQWLQANNQHITLADVVPENGVVVLSLHYQSGLQVSPPRVQLEREPDPHDPIPLVRLRVPGPVSHLTLTWRQP